MKKFRLTMTNVIATSVASLVSASVIMSGTWAWQSFDQQVENKLSGFFLGAGGRLHTNFNGDLGVKEIFIENYKYALEDIRDNTELSQLNDQVNILGNEIYVRVRMEEYLELGADAGLKVDPDTGTVIQDRTGLDIDIVGVGSELGVDADIHNTDTWDIVHMNNDGVYGIGLARSYVGLVLGDGKTQRTDGSAIYMPTFNLNDDSVKGDVNGTLAGFDGDERDLEGAYDDYVRYTLDSSQDNGSNVIYARTGDQVYDVDDNDTEENSPGPGNIFTNPAIHYATETLVTEEVIAMKEWEVRYDSYLDTLSDYNDAMEANPERENPEDENYLPEPVEPEGIKGAFWVFDEDGWVYWAQPLEPRTATGVLLKKAISYQKDVGEWYYEISARAEYATRGDWGKDAEDPLDDTGFYETSITDSAKDLLQHISGTTIK